MAIQKPRLIAETDDLDQFDSADEAINVWLRTMAQKSHKLGYARVSVVTDGPDQVIGYVTLSAYPIERAIVPHSTRPHPAPDLIPATLIGQLGVDRAYSGAGIGSGLLRHALLEAYVASTRVASRAVIVHLCDSTLENYYQRFGFISLKKAGKPTMLLRMDLIAETLAAQIND